MELELIAAHEISKEFDESRGDLDINGFPDCYKNHFTSSGLRIAARFHKSSKERSNQMKFFIITPIRMPNFKYECNVEVHPKMNWHGSRGDLCPKLKWHENYISIYYTHDEERRRDDYPERANENSFNLFRFNPNEKSLHLSKLFQGDIPESVQGHYALYRQFAYLITGGSLYLEQLLVNQFPNSKGFQDRNGFRKEIGYENLKYINIRSQDPVYHESHLHCAEYPIQDILYENGRNIICMANSFAEVVCMATKADRNTYQYPLKKTYILRKYI